MQFFSFSLIASCTEYLFLFSDSCLIYCLIHLLFSGIDIENSFVDHLGNLRMTSASIHFLNKITSSTLTSEVMLFVSLFTMLYYIFF